MVSVCVRAVFSFVPIVRAISPEYVHIFSAIWSETEIRIRLPLVSLAWLQLNATFVCLYIIENRHMQTTEWCSGIKRNVLREANASWRLTEHRCQWAANTFRLKKKAKKKRSKWIGAWASIKRRLPKNGTDSSWQCLKSPIKLEAQCRAIEKGCPIHNRRNSKLSADRVSWNALVKRNDGLSCERNRMRFWNFVYCERNLCAYSI